MASSGQAVGQKWPTAIVCRPLFWFTRPLCPLSIVSPHSRQRLIFAKGKSDGAAPQLKVLPWLPSPWIEYKLLALARGPFCLILCLDLRPLWVPWDMLPAFHTSSCVSNPLDAPHSVCSTYPSFRCELNSPSLDSPLRLHQLPTPRFPAPLHLFHGHHNSAPRSSHCGAMGLDWWHLGSAGVQVRSPAWHSSGLMIWYCRNCSLGCNHGSDLIPGLGIPYAPGQPKTNKQMIVLLVHADTT